MGVSRTNPAYLDGILAALSPPRLVHPSCPKTALTASRAIGCDVASSAILRTKSSDTSA